MNNYFEIHDFLHDTTVTFIMIIDKFVIGDSNI